MTKLTTSVLMTLASCVSVFVSVGSVCAQSGDLFVSGGPVHVSNAGLGSLSSSGKKDDFKLDDGFRIGFRFGLNGEGRMGHEFGYGYNRTHLISNSIDQGGMAIHQGGYNFLLFANRDGSKIRPFATGGGHFNNYVPPGSSASNGGGSTKFGFNYGGGVKVNVGPKFAVRFDVRQYQTGKPFDLLLKSGLFRQLEISGGFGIHF